jgi:hypothetical protein
MNDEGRVLDGKDRQEGDSAGIRGLEERCWMRFLKGMVTDRNNHPLIHPFDQKLPLHHSFRPELAPQPEQTIHRSSCPVLALQPRPQTPIQTPITNHVISMT